MRNHVKELAAEARQGNVGARVQLRIQMETQMVFIVRRTLRQGKAVSSLDHQIIAAAHRFDAHQVSHDPESRIRAIAASLCQAALSNLTPAPHDVRNAQETVVENLQATC